MAKSKSFLEEVWGKEVVEKVKARSYIDKKVWLDERSFVTEEPYLAPFTMGSSAAVTTDEDIQRELFIKGYLTAGAEIDGYREVTPALRIHLISFDRTTNQVHLELYLDGASAGVSLMIPVSGVHKLPLAPLIDRAFVKRTISVEEPA